MAFSPEFRLPYSWLGKDESEQLGVYLFKLLRDCANHVALGNIDKANFSLEQISHLASPDGYAPQRIAAYISEAFADRMLRRWPGLHIALNSTKKFPVDEEIRVQRYFYDLCPFLRLAYLLTNQAIIDAIEGEKMVHIIDLYASEPDQWLDLLHSLSRRREGPPHLRITGIHKHREVLENMAIKLTREAEKLDIAFQFHPVVSKLESLDLETLRIKTGEALCVSSVRQLHSLLATNEELFRVKSPLVSNNQRKVFQRDPRTFSELLKKDQIMKYMAISDPTSTLSPLSLSASARMESFLSSLWGFSPKVMVITEQEANHGFTLMERVTGALNFYAALFDCLQSAALRATDERQKVEKMLFGEEIRNIIACEGAERKERHETLEKWILRLELAGFGKVPFSYHNRLQASALLQSGGYDGYRIKEDNGCLLICWHECPLFSVSAWRFRRYD